MHHYLELTIMKKIDEIMLLHEIEKESWHYEAVLVSLFIYLDEE